MDGTGFAVALSADENDSPLAACQWDMLADDEQQGYRSAPALVSAARRQVAPGHFQRERVGHLAGEPQHEDLASLEVMLV